MRCLILLLCVAAAPASAPSTQPSVESDLRRVIASLQRQLVDLRTENAELRKKLAMAPKPPPAIQDRRIVVGTKIEDALRIIPPNVYTMSKTERKAGAGVVVVEVWESTLPSAYDHIPDRIMFRDGVCIETIDY